MLNLNTLDKEDALAIIKELFNEMCSSRRQLKPILTEILRAIDNNLFIDADSDEVKELLERILHMQTNLSQVDDLKKAAATKNLSVIDAAITEIDHNRVVAELKAVLSKFKTLICDSDDDNEIDAAKKLKRQAHKLSVKADKISADRFAEEGSKFIAVAEKIEDPSKFTSNSFLELQEAFPENRFLAYTIMKHSLHFDTGEDSEADSASIAPPDIKAVEQSEEPQYNTESNIDSEEEEELEQEREHLKTLAEDLALPFDGLLIDEDAVTIESKNLKKKISVKSLTNKLHEFADGSESVTYPLLRTLCKSRVASTDSIFEEYHRNERSGQLIPIVVDKLYNWGIADKVYWKGMTFYYLNDTGRELLIRALSLKLCKSSLGRGDSPKTRLIAYLRRFILFSTVWSLRVKNSGNKLDADTGCYWIRSISRHPKATPHVLLSFSLLFLSEDWVNTIQGFIQAVEDEEKCGRHIKGIFLICNLAQNQIDIWIKYFRELGITCSIYIFVIAEGTYKLLDEGGEEIKPGDWVDAVSYGIADDDQNDLFEDLDLDDEDYDEGDSDGSDDSDDSDEGSEIGVVDEVDDEAVDTAEAWTEERFESANETAETFEADSAAFDDYVKTLAEGELVPPPVKKADTDAAETKAAAVEAKSKGRTRVEPKVEIEAAIETSKVGDAVTAGSVDILTELAATNPLPTGTTSDLIQMYLKQTAHRFEICKGGRGMLLLHMLRTDPAFSTEARTITDLTLCIGYILDDPLYPRLAANFDPFDFWDTFLEIPNAVTAEDSDYLKLAAMIKSFYAPPEPMSFQLKSRWNQINDDKASTAIKACPSAKKLIGLFKNFSEKTHASFVSCLNVDHSAIEAQFKSAVDAVKAVRERTDAVSHMQLRHPRSIGLVKLLYEPRGEVRRLLTIEDPSLTEDEIIDYCSQFTEEDLRRLDQQGTLVDEAIFPDSKVGGYLDEIWSSIKVDSRRNERFASVERPRQINVLRQALTAMLSYAFAKHRIDAVKNSGTHTAPVAKVFDILKDLNRELDMADPGYHAKPLGYFVFSLFVMELTSRLRGENIPLFYRDCLLGSKYLELGNDGIPAFKSYDIPAFSFTNRVLAFDSTLENLSPKEAVDSAYETAVRGCDLGILTLLEANFRDMLNRSDEELKRRRDNVSKQLERQLDRIYHEFLDNIELDRNYDRITNQEAIEQYISIAAETKEHFSETKNAGLYQRFLNACRSEIAKAALPHKNAMEQRLKSLEDSLYTDLGTDEELNDKYPILAEIHRQLDLGNLTVAEDYLNRWSDLGGQIGSFEAIESRNDAFEDFLREYEYIFNACLKNKSESLEKIHTRLRGGSAKNRTERDAADFVSAWQGLNTDYKAKARAETSLVELLRHLSFGSAAVEKAEKIPPNQWNFHVTFPDYRRSKAAYPHPFAVFGTDIAVKGLNVTYLAGNRSADNIIETLTNYAAKHDCGTLCLVDFALSLAERRRLAQAFKLRPDLKDIVVIDRVLAIYLTHFEDSVRGVKLLKTALPFARVQPYTTGGVVAPEMFIGRSKELAKIRDMSGPVFVYGGRQLGKSALLRQVRNIENDPENGGFAFFIELKGLDADKSLDKIVRELKEGGLIRENEAVDNWDDFSAIIRNLLSGKAKEYKIIDRTPEKLILLLDESDEFLASAADSDNRAIDVLRELRETFSGRFKFVLAGLHKVIRFEKNSSFGNLDHISVLPFTPTDALELLIKPMSFMGFTIEDESLMSAIFSRSNYYPGLIQYYCKMIVDAAGDNYANRNFDVTKNPPYKLNDEYLKNMLGKRDFQDEINKKFQITLKLDDDNFYEIIALVIAMAYYEQNRPVYVSIDKIKETCYIYDIDKIADMSSTELESLLSEMVELNLLRKVEDSYGFNRYAFWHMMGTELEVDTRLSSYGK